MKFLKSTLAGTRFLGSTDASALRQQKQVDTTHGTETYSQKPIGFSDPIYPHWN